MRSPGALPLIALAATSATVATVAIGAADRGEAGPTPNYERDIAPILSDHCYACHGPDAAQRKAKLRLDTRDGALAEREDGPAIVPGDAAASLLVQRITAADPGDRMPPAKTGKTLTEREVALLRAWIDSGAEYARHWAFEPPVKRELPPVARADWPRNEVDSFVLARLESEGLAPSPEAARETLLRRASLTLTGLPPSIGELDRFLADGSADAYERAVDRLLDSPRYAEHMARYWLDAARYGDTHGYHLDNERSAWPWRDWVIAAFAANQPFDQFTVEQLAGDLLPDATDEQKIATGFNRCNPSTGEGGLIAEEYLAKYAMDRVETTSTVWLGLTMTCARCHDHKYDPFTQEDYYRLFSIFDDVAGEASDENALAPQPVLRVAAESELGALARLDGEVASAQAALDAPMPEVDAAQATWERSLARKLDAQWFSPRPVAAQSTGGSTLRILPDASIVAEGANPDTDTFEVVIETDRSGLTGLVLELMPDERFPGRSVGRAHNGNFVLTDLDVRAEPIDGGDAVDVAFAIARADHEQEQFPLANVFDDRPDTGWAILPQTGEPHVALLTPAEPVLAGARGVRLTVRLGFSSVYAQHALGRFRISLTDDANARPTALGPWSSAGPFGANTGPLALQTDFGPESGRDVPGANVEGGVEWTARPEFADGVANLLTGSISAVYLHRKIAVPSARHVRLAIGSDDALAVWLDGREVHRKDVARALTLGEDSVEIDLEPGEHDLLLKVVNYGGDFAFSFQRAEEELLGAPLAVARTLLAARELRTDALTADLRRHFRARHAPQWQERSLALASLVAERAQLEASIPRTLVMSERDMARPTRVLTRGRYDAPGAEVASGVPSALPPLPEGAPANRLGLARWLVDPAHPLTARVFVNRVWQMHFGVGLVKTAEDFGTRGDWPSHAELLDWLAVDFVEHGWDLKRLHRQIVTSATYRQASRHSPELDARDPENRLLARGPRVRLDAEVLRDSALAMSGLLVERVGGKSVKPYQPGNLWKVVGFPGSNTENFARDDGEALYRRSLYTFWKRTAPPANLQVFDAPTREVSCVRRERTNTPLQALVLLNDEQFVEAARALAERVLREGGASDEGRATLGFRIATARLPDDGERSALVSLARDAFAAYRLDEAAAIELVHAGESEPDPALDRAELAAWTIAASVLLNLDEVVSLQ